MEFYFLSICMGAACGDFMFVAVLYVVKIVASFYKVQCEHIQRGVVGSKYVFRFKFPGVCDCQELAKLNDL